jgi:hypothetical protein
MRTCVCERARSWTATAVCASFALALHGALVSSLVLYGAAAYVDPKQKLYAGSSVGDGEEFSTTLVFVEASVAAQADSEASPTGFPPITLTRPELPADEPAPEDQDALPDATEESAMVSAEPAGDAAQAALRGKYTGQVAARIERAWTLPRSVENAADFACQVRIEQDRDGNVLSTELLRCDDDTSWQLSLVHAIERASPLTAPPDPSVFSQQLVLSFSASTHSLTSVPLAGTPASIEVPK